MRKPITPNGIRKRKNSDQKISLVTAYDYPMARWADEAEIDIVFVSDAFASVGLGRENTLSVTIDEVIYHTRAVRAGSGQCLVLASMPFMSHSTPKEAVKNASRLIKEGGAHAVEIEGSGEAAKVIAAVVDAGVPVVAHVGLTKYIASRTGQYINQGKTVESAVQVIDDARRFEKAGAFAIVVECIPGRIAEILTKTVDVPTIGFGAGPECDGQALVSQDMLGMFDKFRPKFVKQYAELGNTVKGAFSAFRWEIERRDFPGEVHTIPVDDSVVDDVMRSFSKAEKKKAKKAKIKKLENKNLKHKRMRIVSA